MGAGEFSWEFLEGEANKIAKRDSSWKAYGRKDVMKSYIKVCRGADKRVNSTL